MSYNFPVTIDYLGIPAALYESITFGNTVPLSKHKTKSLHYNADSLVKWSSNCSTVSGNQCVDAYSSAFLYASTNLVGIATFHVNKLISSTGAAVFSENVVYKFFQTTDQFPSYISYKYSPNDLIYPDGTEFTAFSYTADYETLSTSSNIMFQIHLKASGNVRSVELSELTDGSTLPPAPAPTQQPTIAPTNFLFTARPT